MPRDEGKVDGLEGITVSYQLGVDLGTTFTAAAVARGGRVEISSLDYRTAAIPSVVWVGADGTVVRSASYSLQVLGCPSQVQTVPVVPGMRRRTRASGWLSVRSSTWRTRPEALKKATPQVSRAAA